MKQIASLFIYFILVSQIKSEEQEEMITVVIKDETNNGSGDINEQFSWHVAVLRLIEEDLVFLCSGTVVASEYIITAAKCVISVPTEDLRVLITQKNLHKLPFETFKNQDDIFKVTNKHYRYHPDGLVLEKDLSILRLQALSPFMSTNLTSLLPTQFISNHCFTIGWGLQYKMNPSKERCPRHTLQDIINFPSEDMEQNDITLRGLNVRNILALSREFILKIGQMFNFPSDTHHENLKASISQEGTCPADEIAYRQKGNLSAKYYYKYYCLRSDESQLCLYSRQPRYLVKQVDIGSPVFCKTQEAKSQNSDSGMLDSQYVLTGIITNIEKIPVHKYKSSVNFITATTSLDIYTKLLFTLVETEN